MSSERASTQDPEATRVEHHVLRARIDRGKVGTWWALGLCALLYLYVFPYQERINNPNENVRFYMTAALVEDGTYAIDGPRARWGWVNDAGVRDGHYYSVKAPGTSLLGVPAYAAYRAYARWTDTPFERTRALYYCRLFASVLPTLIFAFFFHRFLGRHTHDAASRDGVFFSVLVGSLLYGYGLLFVSHTASAIAAGGALILIADDPRSLRRPSWAAFATGLLAALVTWFEYPGLIASASLASAALVRFGVRRAPFIAAGGLLPTLSMMHFQWKAWGSPLTPGHRFLENESFRALSEQGFFGATTFSRAAAEQLLFDPGFGLFPLTPILLFALPGAYVGLRRAALRVPTSCALVICIGTYLAICTMNNWRGGWTVGPRYLAVVVPLLGFLALLGLDALLRWGVGLVHGAVVASLLIGLAASGAVSAYYPHVPEAMTRPVRDLVEPLARYDFAPYNAGNLFGLFGTRSMLPWAMLALLAFATVLVRVLRAGSGVQPWIAVIAASSLLVTGSRVSLTVATETNQAAGALAFVTSRWEPSGHDALSALEEVPGEQRDAVWEQRVIRVYRALGREREARAVENRTRAPRGVRRRGQ